MLQDAFPSLTQPVELRLAPGTQCLLAVSSPDSTASAFGLVFGPAPSNDDFADAAPLMVSSEGGTVRVEGTNVFATVEQAETLAPNLAWFRRHGNLWWQFTAEEFGGALFHLLESPQPTIAAVYTGPSLGQLELLVGPDTAGVNPVAWVPFSVRPGVTYWIAAGAHPDHDDPLGPMAGTFEFEPMPERVNDPFEDRRQLDGISLSLEGTTLHATSEPDEPEGMASTLWWEWTAPGYGAVRIEALPLTLGNASRAFLFTGSRLSELRPATIGDVVYVDADQRVQIAVGTLPGHGNPGPFRLNIHWRPTVAPSPNDAFGDRIELPAEPYTVTGNLDRSTLEPGEFPSGPGGSLWWRFAAPATGVLELTELEADSFSPAMELLPGDDFGSLGRPLDSSFRARTAWRVEAGRVYALRISAGGGTPGEFTLSSRFWRPTNDRFADAIRLDGPSPRVDTWMVDAGIESGEPLPAPDASQSLWWRWVAPGDGRLEQPWVSELLPLATVYEGPGLGGLLPVPLVPPSPHLGTASAVTVTGGREYFVQFTAPAGRVEALRFDLQFAAFGTADNDHFHRARRIEGPAVASMASVIGASREAGEPLHGSDARHPSVWWRYTASTDGRFTVENAFGSVRGVMLAVYRGSSVDALTWLGSGVDSVSVTLGRGETCAIAAVVPPGSHGDVGIRILTPQGGNFPKNVEGNLVKNYSFERVVDGDPTSDWEAVPGVGWVIGAPSLLPAADGSNYAVLHGQSLRQVLETTAGQPYRIRLAVRPTLEPGDVDVRIRFGGNEVGRIAIPSVFEERFWHWRDFEVVATGTVSALEVVGAGTWVVVDAISVVGLAEPPRIVSEPAALTGLVGEALTMAAGVEGSEPLTFEWFHGEDPIPRGYERRFTLDSVRQSDAGAYRVRVSNPWGVVVHEPVILRVEGSDGLSILRHPVGEQVLLGQYYVLYVLAGGAGPHEYQWFHNGRPVPEGAERRLIFDAVRPEDLGTYHVVVQSGDQSLTSLPASLGAEPDTLGGGTTRFAAWAGGAGEFLVQVSDVDGSPLLEGPEFAAQLYAGLSSETLRPVGVPQPFLTDALAGRWRSQNLVLPHVAPGAAFHAQIRAWDASIGASYEEARARGGRFGRSPVTTAVAGDPVAPPEPIATLESFSLQAGQPGFTAGRIEAVRIETDGTVVWRLTGAAGFRYLLEEQSGSRRWIPRERFIPLSSPTLFTTPPHSDGLILYRARVLD